MLKNQFPLTAVVLILMGLAGIFTTAWLGGSSMLSGPISSMMMGSGMMGRG